MSDSSDEGGNDKKSYRVGYGKPPMETRFKKGQPQEFRRRSKQKQTRREVIARIAYEQVTLIERGRSRKVSADEGIHRVLRNKALSGDPKAQAQWINSICKELDQMERENQVKEYQSLEISKALRNKLEDMHAKYLAQEAAKKKDDDDAKK
jgi:Family of unknown function (DUF5681)